MMIQPQQVEVGSVKDMGRVLFKEFLLPFEISSVLLLVAMIGAVMLGKNEEEGKNAS
jgi:NADH-quinone oxidoreductase subunit J